MNVRPPPANDGLDGVGSPSHALLNLGGLFLRFGGQDGLDAGKTQLDSVLRTGNDQDVGGSVQVELGPGGLLEFFNGGAPLSDDDQWVVVDQNRN